MDKDEAVLRLVVRATVNNAQARCINAGLDEYPLLPLDMHREMFPNDNVYANQLDSLRVTIGGVGGGGFLGAQQAAGLQNAQTNVPIYPDDFIIQAPPHDPGLMARLARKLLK